MAILTSVLFMSYVIAAVFSTNTEQVDSSLIGQEDMYAEVFQLTTYSDTSLGRSLIDNNNKDSCVLGCSLVDNVYGAMDRDAMGCSIDIDTSNAESVFSLMEDDDLSDIESSNGDRLPLTSTPRKVAPDFVDVEQYSNVLATPRPVPFNAIYLCTAVMDYDDVITKEVLNNTRVSPSFISTSDDRSLTFSTSAEDSSEMLFTKPPKSIRNPTSNRIIEKRRRDRMNNCLADLSNIIPTNCIKQGKGRIAKTEIINVAIQHIKNLTKEVSRHGALQSSMPDRYLGYKECQDEVMRCLVEVEGWDKMDQLCASIVAHLEQQGKKFRIMNDESISQIAKEEQYRNADEEQYDPSIKVMKAVCQEPKDLYRGTTLVTMEKPPNVPCHTSLSNNRITETSYLVHGALESIANAQEMTLEHLKRDKRQWTLLTTKYDSPMIEDSGLSTGSESVAHTNKRSVYKCKHNILKRFYRDEEEASPSDRSSRCSRDEKRMFGHLRSYCTSNSGSGSSRYPTSDSFYIKRSGSHFENSMVMENTKASNLLAGFVLHPSGTHYLPLSIHLSDMADDFFSKPQQDPRVYHPINIPVDFSGKNQSCPTKRSVSADSSGESSCPSEAANCQN